MVRRALAAGAGLLVLLLLVFGVRGCLDSRKDSAINDWVRDVDALMKESNGESDALFEQLDGGAGGTDVEVENALNSFRIQSAQLVDRAEDLDHPGDLDSAQSHLVETLNFRAEGIAQIADALPSALTDGDQAEGAAQTDRRRDAALPDQRPDLRQARAALDQRGAEGRRPVPEPDREHVPARPRLARAG